MDLANHSTLWSRGLERNCWSSCLRSHRDFLKITLHQLAPRNFAGKDCLGSRTQSRMSWAILGAAWSGGAERRITGCWEVERTPLRFKWIMLSLVLLPKKGFINEKEFE
ncbi:conserved hypothetical protein [Coccidioides posadasii str. Silveira]|uniref:Uncharacterized protein n=1 Tax=Coccidioides posadasii (strain RMSCC 757 / Silveira) TaxID=443226 RepID=E9D6P0_COCPS|nr:conserved hypothetical protein [Coccidioides posadasii str. Silveira]